LEVATGLFYTGEIDESRFAIAGFADTKPLVPNETTENRAKNRRVEIVLQEKTDQEVKQEVIDVRDIYEQSTPEEKKRIFELDPAEIF
jgi:chemotaxis protein MotB